MRFHRLALSPANTGMSEYVVDVVARSPIRPILGFGGRGKGSEVQKMGDSLPRTPMNRRPKFDPASFITDREIRNRTKHEHTNMCG